MEETLEELKVRVVKNFKEGHGEWRRWCRFLEGVSMTLDEKLSKQVAKTMDSIEGYKFIAGCDIKKGDVVCFNKDGFLVVGDTEDN